MQHPVSIQEKQLIVLGRESGVFPNNTNLSNLYLEFEAKATGQINRDFSSIKDDKVYCYHNESLTHRFLIRWNKIENSLSLKKEDINNCSNMPSDIDFDHVFYRTTN